MENTPDIFSYVENFITKDPKALIDFLNLLKNRAFEKENQKNPRAFKKAVCFAFVLASARGLNSHLEALLLDPNLAPSITPNFKDGSGATALSLALREEKEDTALFLLNHPRLRGQHDMFLNEEILDVVSDMFGKAENHQKVVDILNLILDYEDIPFPKTDGSAILFLRLQRVGVYAESAIEKLFNRVPSQQAILRTLFRFTENAPSEDILNERASLFQKIYCLSSEKTKDNFFFHKKDDLEFSKFKQHYQMVFARESKKGLLEEMDRKNVKKTRKPKQKI